MTSTDERGSRPRAGSAVPARWRIVGWMLLVLAFSMTVVIITVRSAMIAEGDNTANGSISREVNEVVGFVEIGRDPETAAPFTDLDRFFQIYLARQNPEPGEVMISVTAGDLRTAKQVNGPLNTVPDLEDAGLNALEAGGDVSLLQQMLTGPTTGVIDTPVGSVRYARVDIVQGGEPGSLVIAQFDEPLMEQTNDAIRLLVLISLVALLVGGLLSWFVAGQILRPVRTVRQAAEEITEHDLTRRIPVQGNDDISELAVTFNEMLDRLDNAFSLQQRFVDDVSHELRTPITIVRGHLEMMGTEPGADTEATRALILDELDRMTRIVSDLLVLAKAERTDFVQIESAVDIAELTIELDAKVTVLGARRWQLGEIADGFADVDPQRIQQAVLQLAQNAVEHTAEDATIEVSSSFGYDPHLGRVVRFTVRDEGQGIDPDDLELIFDRFNRGTAGGHRGPGVGLGLAIVKAIVDGHGGSVVVDSAVGRGATFGLLIPIGSGRARPQDDDFGHADPTDARAASPRTTVEVRESRPTPAREDEVATVIMDRPVPHDVGPRGGGSR